MCAGLCDAAAALYRFFIVRIGICRERRECLGQRRICGEDLSLLLEVDARCADKVAPVDCAGGDRKEFARILDQCLDALILPEVAAFWRFPTKIAAEVSRQ